MSQSPEFAAGGAPPAGEKAPRRAIARFAYPVLLIVGVICLYLLNHLVWIDTSILDTQEFTDTVTGVLRQDDVRQRTADVLARQAVEAGDLQGRVDQRLPEDTSFLAPIVAAQLEPLLAQVTERLLATDLAGELETGVVTNLHRQVVAVLEDKGAVEVQGDAIVLNLQDIEDRIFKRIGITPPQRLQGRLGESGQVVLVEDASALRQTSFLVKNRIWFSSALLVGAIAAFAGAVMVAPGRRRGLRLVGYSVGAVALLTLLTLLISNLVLNSVAGERLVLREMVRALEGNLRWQSVGLLVLGATLLVLADETILAGVDKLSARGETALRVFGVGRAALILAAVLAVVLLVV